jgi:hypothetical protein
MIIVRFFWRSAISYMTAISCTPVDTVTDDYILNTFGPYLKSTRGFVEKQETTLEPLFNVHPVHIQVVAPNQSNRRIDDYLFASNLRFLRGSYDQLGSFHLEVSARRRARSASRPKFGRVDSERIPKILGQSLDKS